MSKKILIIDDEQLILKALEEHFTRDGYTTAVAGDGEEGLRIVDKFKPDLIILDVIMPKMDGLTVLTKLKHNPITSNIPIIILTNIDEKDTLTKAISSGCHHYFLKINYSADELSKEVNKILTKK